MLHQMCHKNGKTVTPGSSKMPLMSSSDPSPQRSAKNTFCCDASGGCDWSITPTIIILLLNRSLIWRMTLAHSGGPNAMHSCMFHTTDVLCSSQAKQPEQCVCARLDLVPVCRFTRLTLWCHIEQTWTDNINVESLWQSLWLVYFTSALTAHPVLERLEAIPIHDFHAAYLQSYFQLHSRHADLS